MTDERSNARLEAFSDGVFAFALTLLIIDIKIPAAESIATTAGVWRALQNLAPAASAFLLSFTVIFITWVNHHGAMRLIRRSSAHFIYANGFLLLTIVFIPFPTSLLGDLVLTPHAAPAVVLYNAVLAVQSIPWILFATTAIDGNLTVDEDAVAVLREARRDAYYALTLYSLLTIAAFWFPLSAAIVTAASWLFWLILSLRLKHS